MPHTKSRRAPLDAARRRAGLPEHQRRVEPPRRGQSIDLQKKLAMERVLINVQNALAAQGVRGTTHILAQFRKYDVDGGGVLDRDEFGAAMRGAGLRVQDRDVAGLFASMDADGNGGIDWLEFARALSGRLSPRRRDVIKRVWKKLSGGKPTATLSDVGACFRADKHPDVSNGTAEPSDVLADFVEALKACGCLDSSNSLTEERFLEFYRLSAAFVGDGEFEATAEAVWAGRREAAGPTRAATGGRDAHEALDVLRGALKRRGVRGVVALARNFRIADADGSSALTEEEFERSLKLSQCDLPDESVRALFRRFDQDGSGQVDATEFMTTLKGPLAPRRRELISTIFSRLDTDGSGAIEPSEVVSKYDASKHPDVISGKKTSDEVLREFLDTFDVGGVIDGKVTAREFETYYHSVSSSIDDDDHFELMLRNAWHLAGGEGWCANSANLRCLVSSRAVTELHDAFKMISRGGTDNVRGAESRRRPGRPWTGRGPAAGYTWIFRA